MMRSVLPPAARSVSSRRCASRRPAQARAASHAAPPPRCSERAMHSAVSSLSPVSIQICNRMQPHDTLNPFIHDGRGPSCRSGAMVSQYLFRV